MTMNGMIAYRLQSSGIVNRKLLPPYVRRIVVACVLLAAVLMLPLPASAGLNWNIGAGIGYLASVAAVVLYLYPLRAHGVPHRRLFALSQHRRIGWVALYIAGLHAAILLAAQPLIGHYLFRRLSRLSPKPSPESAPVG